MDQNTNQRKPLVSRHPALLPLLEDSPSDVQSPKSTVRRVANKEFIESLSLLEPVLEPILSGKEAITSIEPKSDLVFPELDELADAVADIEAYIKNHEQL